MSAQDSENRIIALIDYLEKEIYKIEGVLRVKLDLHDNKLLTLMT